MAFRSQRPAERLCPGNSGFRLLTSRFSYPAAFWRDIQGEALAWLRFMLQGNKLKCILAIIITFVIIHVVEHSSIIPFVLLPFWFFVFRPWNKTEGIIFAIASLFFLMQNYFVLKSGGFYFKHRDILLMPYYEPFLWGFYYITIKRFISESPTISKMDWKSFLGLAITGLCFSLFSNHSNILLISTLISTGILLTLFHARYDFYYALCALVLGLVTEIFGVSTGLWSYPEPDFVGIPFWSATMWISVGLLGRRFLIPLATWLSVSLD
jgi:hypothetical protein